MGANELQKYIRGSGAASIASGIEAAIREGALAPAARLPTVRGLAEALGVSPTTVAAAYRTLGSRGVVVSEGRRGTRVSFAPPVPVARAAPLPESVLDLSAGNPDPALLPDLRPALAALARAREAAPVLYGHAAHDPGLVDLARARFAADRIPCDALAVVSGALDGIERVLASRLRPGDRVAVEDPGFGGVLHLVRALGLSILPVAVDDEGPLPEALEAALRAGAQAAIVTPRAQNPTGAALSAGRARVLRDLAARHADVLFVEDDHAADVAGAPARSAIPKGARHWAVVRSVSKALGPDLRTALLAGDAETIARVEGRQLLGLRWVSHVLQGLVVRLWRDKSVGRALRRAERTYTQRRDALLAALAERGIAAHGRSGLNVWVPVAEEATALRTLEAAGFAVAPGERYRLQSPPAIRITTATLPPSEAPRLADALTTSSPPHLA